MNRFRKSLLAIPYFAILSMCNIVIGRRSQGDTNTRGSGNERKTVRQFLKAVRTLLSCAFLVASGAGAIGQPVLIDELSHMSGGAIGPTQDPMTEVRFRFAVFNPTLSQTFVDWEDQYGPADSGMTFVASPSVVAGVNQALAFANSEYLMETGPGFNSPGIRLSVPPNHFVTSVERIIDQLVLTAPQPGGQFYVFQGKQRIRLWGVLIPEPSINALTAICIGNCLALVRRGRR